MKRANPEFTDKQKTMLQALRDLPDSEIDTSDAPEILDRSNAIRGAFYQPVKREVTLQLDEYVIGWFQENALTGQDCQEDINQVLMQHVRQSQLQALKATREKSPTHTAEGEQTVDN